MNDSDSLLDTIAGLIKIYKSRRRRSRRSIVQQVKDLNIHNPKDEVAIDITTVSSETDINVSGNAIPTDIHNISSNTRNIPSNIHGNGPDTTNIKVTGNVAGDININNIDDLHNKIGDNIDVQLDDIFNDIMALKLEMKNERRNSKVFSAGNVIGTSASISTPVVSNNKKYLAKVLRISLKLLLMVVGSIIGYALCTVLFYFTSLQPGGD